MNPKDAADRENMVKTVERFKELLVKDEEKLADMKRKAGNRDGAASSTDR